MKSLLGVCVSAALLLLAGLCQPAFAQSDDTLSARLIAAITHHEPMWRVAQPFRGSLYPHPSVRGTLEGEGYVIRVALSAHASGGEVAEILNRKRPLAYMAVQPSPLRTAWRHYQKANVVIIIIADAKQAANDLAEPAGKRPSPASVVERGAQIIDSLILADVRVDACVNELYPDPRPAPASRREAFFRDVEAGCLPRVEQGLAAGADANARDAQGATPLWRAVAAGHREVTQALLRAGAKPDAIVAATGTPSFRILSRPSSYNIEDLPGILANQLSLLDDLVAAGADLETRNEYGRTLLLEVARMNYDDGSPNVLLKGLTERGANVLARDRNGRTAVILAVMDTHPKVNFQTLPILLAAGVDVNAQDAVGKTAMDYARERADSLEEWQRVLRLLAGAGATQSRDAQTGVIN